MSDEVIADLLARMEAAERTIAQQSLLIAEHQMRMVTLEGESVYSDEYLKLAVNIHDAFNAIARILAKSESEIYDPIWRRRNDS